jgi:hypothetical protein
MLIYLLPMFQAGDEIVQVNGTRFTRDITHSQAVSVLKGSRQLHMHIRKATVSNSNSNSFL